MVMQLVNHIKLKLDPNIWLKNIKLHISNSIQLLMTDYS